MPWMIYINKQEFTLSRLHFPRLKPLSIWCLLLVFQVVPNKGWQMTPERKGVTVDAVINSITRVI